MSQLGNTPLLLAAKNGFGDVVKLLLAAGAGLSATDPAGKTALTWAHEARVTQSFHSPAPRARAIHSRIAAAVSRAVPTRTAVTAVIAVAPVTHPRPHAQVRPDIAPVRRKSCSEAIRLLQDATDGKSSSEVRPLCRTHRATTAQRPCNDRETTAKRSRNDRVTAIQLIGGRPSTTACDDPLLPLQPRARRARYAYMSECSLE